MCLPLLLVIVVSVRVVTFFAYDVGLAFLPLLVELLEMTLWTCVLDSWDLFWNFREGQKWHFFFYLLILHAPLHCVVLHAGYTFVCIIWFCVGNLSFYSGLEVVVHYSFSKSMEFMNCLNWVRYLFTRTHFCIGQSSSLDIDAISSSLSLSSFPQSNIRCSAIWSPLAQTHSGDIVILNRCRYAFVFLCATLVTAVSVSESIRNQRRPNYVGKGGVGPQSWFLAANSGRSDSSAVPP